jgi:hypothetical protein
VVSAATAGTDYAAAAHTHAGDTLGPVEKIQFDTTPAGVATTVGDLIWNVGEETLDLQLDGFVMHVGQHLIYHAQNSTGTAIAKGAPVMFAGTTGGSGKLLIKPWDGLGPATLFMGITGEAFANGHQGSVVAFGKVTGIQTNGANYGQTWTDGTIAYVGTTAGTLTNVKPSYPNPIVEVLAVVNAHASNGIVFVRPNYILADTFAPTSSTDNAIVRFDGTTGKLIQNSGITVADGATGTLSGTNSGDVTLAGTPSYLTISGQEITRNQVNLTAASAHVTGTLPVANGGTGQTALSSIDAADFGSGAAVDNYILAADGSSGATWESPAALGIVATNSSASLKDLALNPDTLTSTLATSALNISQTWNTTGVPTLVKGYVANTASGANSKLFDFGVDSTTRLNLDLSGHLYTNASDDYAAYGFLNSARGIGYSSAFEKMVMYANASGVVNAGVDSNGLFLPETGKLSWSSSGWASASDLFLSRAAAATLQLGVNHATTATRQIIKGHNVSTGNNTGAELNFRAGNGANGVPGTQGIWFGNTASSSMKIYDSLAGVVLGGYYNEGLRGFLRMGGGSGGEVTLASNSTDGNIALTPHGTGKVKFGTFVTSASHTASGYIEIRDAGGTIRKLAVVS